MNFENIFSPNVFVWTLPAIAACLLNTPRDRCAFVDLGTILLKMFFEQLESYLSHHFITLFC